ncbi:hypothetical protein LOD99_4325 [Oopsacas minuta]|uniref:Transmembrane BAX inhibitor motif-containing protein 4 n=1 Tax=Oopsacas minuta TaxID=111878 RepID=A0AAV7JVS4_9METZ|nr:hypothetical protein LOD99_4325 [Oopsacas minuta]
MSFSLEGLINPEKGPYREDKYDIPGDEDQLELGPRSSRSNVSQAAIHVRLGFLRRVYFLLAIQLTLTTIVSIAFIKHEGIREFIATHPGLLTFDMIILFPILFALMFFKESHPTNLILLFTFTLGESLVVGQIVTLYELHAVITAFMLSLSVFFILTMYTLQSSYDFSTWGACLFTFLWILLIGSIVHLLFPTEIGDLMISLAGAIIFSGFIILDTHMIMHKLSPDDYIMATITLYLDMINLFLYILKMMKKKE